MKVDMKGNNVKWKLADIKVMMSHSVEKASKNVSFMNFSYLFTSWFDCLHIKLFVYTFSCLFTFQLFVYIFSYLFTFSAICFSAICLLLQKLSFFPWSYETFFCYFSTLCSLLPLSSLTSRTTRLMLWPNLLKFLVAPVAAKEKKLGYHHIPRWFLGCFHLRFIFAFSSFLR